MSIENPSITFFIATIGRRTLKNCIRSLYGQFNHGVDRIEVFFDGPNFYDADPAYFKPEQDLYGEDLIMHVLPENLGYWGHAIRNAYQNTFHTDYIHNCDDDDYYPEAALLRVRSDIQQHYGKLLMYKFRNSDGIQWHVKNIQHGNVGTPTGMIPNRPEIMGEWGYGNGGDYVFYLTTQDKIGKNNIVWIDHIIYKIRPHVYGL